MADLIAIVPSRGRPAQCRALISAFRATCTAGTRLVFSVDATDPCQSEYTRLPFETPDFPTEVFVGLSTTMVEALNQIAVNADSFAVAFMGDDHLPRTVGWDTAYLEALRDLGTGMVYGNDLLQGRQLPTQVAMTTDIVRALGYMAPPGLVHLAVDNAWLALGEAAGCIRYLRDVVIEHRHPTAGKAQVDDGYLRVNAPQMYQRDMAEFDRWCEHELPAAVAKVAALRERESW